MRSSPAIRRLRGGGPITSVVVGVIFCGVLAGCTSVPPPPGPSPQPPSPSPLTDEMRAEQSLIGSTWTGIDTAGDTTTFTLEADRTVLARYNGREWNEASDTWALVSGVLTITVHIDATHGDLVYTAPYVEGNGTLQANASASQSGRTLSVTLERR